MKYVIFSLIFLSLLSCDNKTKENTFMFTNEDYVKKTNQNGLALGLRDKLGKPSSFKIVDSLAFVRDEWENGFVDVYNIHNKTHINSIGTKGRGVGELISVSSIEFSDNYKNVWLFDITMSNFHCYIINDVCSGQKANPISSPNFYGLFRGFYNPIFVNDSIIVGTSLLSENRLCYFNRKGNLLSTKGLIPANDKRVPESVLAQAYAVTTAYSEENEKIVLANRYADMIEVYHSNGDLYQIIRGPYNFDPEYYVGKSGNSAVFGQKDDMRFGYINITCSNEEIYALFSGRTRPEFPGIANTGKSIYVFNWNGEIVERIELDRDIIDIEYNNETKSIYGLQINPFPEIYVYKTQN